MNQSEKQSGHRTGFDWWCDRAWLYLVYLLGVIMSCVLVIQWTAFTIPQRLICILTLLLPLHVFEENTWPAGFFYVNNLGFHSDNPMAWPQSRLSNMISNLGGEIALIAMLLVCRWIPVSVVFFVAFFGIGETIHHTRDSFLVYRRYRDQGKKTLYSPGVATSYLGLIQLSAYSVAWLVRNGLNMQELLIGIGLIVLVLGGLILIPLGVSRKLRLLRYAFDDRGYFDRFTD